MAAAASRAMAAQRPSRRVRALGAAAWCAVLAALGVAAEPEPVDVEPPTWCDLHWRPGLTAHVPVRGEQPSAWLSAHQGSRSLLRLERVFDKLLRGERVTVYFLGDSVTRGSGAAPECYSCETTPAPALAHPWMLPAETVARGCEGYNGRLERGGDVYAHCGTRERARLHAHDCPARPVGLDASEPGTTAESSAAELSVAARQCYPRNSWRCLVVQWFEHAFPGQVRTVISSKPLLFMAACFGRALGGVDLLLHEQAVNGGGRMLCLQERIMHAALARRSLAVLMLLWLPKTYHPTGGLAVLRKAQDGLRELGAHYAIPTLAMTIAFAERCAAGESWCYDREHGVADSSKGAAGTLHADLNHPNEGGHAWLAAHTIALLDTTAERVAARFRAARHAGAPRPPRPPLPPRALPEPLYEVNGGLGAAAQRGGDGGEGEEGVHAYDDGGICVDVSEMLATARANSGWAVRTEITKSKVARLPALQADARGAAVEWALDARGADWLIVTYMQSYKDFGAIELRCVSGCACTPHDAPGAPVALINATDPTVRFSEPQWKLLDISRPSAECVVRATSVSPLKFKLMLLSLIRVRSVDEDARASGGADDLRRRTESLRCFGVGEGFAINGRVRSTAPWESIAPGAA